LLFAIHPCHDHPVNGVAARGLLLVGLFSFLSLIFYLLAEQRGLAGAAGEAVPAEKPHEWTYYPLSVICFALGIFSHPLIVTLPIIILVYQLLIADEDNTTIYQRLPGAFKKTAPFFIIVVFYFAVSQMYFHPTSKMVSVHDTPQRAASRPVEMQVKIGTDLLATYFINALGAFNRNHSDMAVLSVFEKIVIFTGMIVFFRAGLWKLKRRRWRALAPFIFFVSLLPSFFMTYSYSNINLRYMYFASTGVFMLVFAILEAYISDAPENKSSKALIYGLIIAFLVFLGYISHYRNAHPMDRQTNPGDMGTKLWCEKTFGYTVPPKLYMHRR
jgi:hypothetical protein